MDDVGFDDGVWLFTCCRLWVWRLHYIRLCGELYWVAELFLKEDRKYWVVVLLGSMEIVSEFFVIVVL